MKVWVGSLGTIPAPTREGISHLSAQASRLRQQPMVPACGQRVSQYPWSTPTVPEACPSRLRQRPMAPAWPGLRPRRCALCVVRTLCAIIACCNRMRAEDGARRMHRCAGCITAAAVSYCAEPRVVLHVYGAMPTYEWHPPLCPRTTERVARALVLAEEWHMQLHLACRMLYC